MSEEEQKLSDEEKLYLWRLQMFLTLGVELDVAEALAASRTDWHVVDSLVNNGCPIETAVRIATEV